VVQVEIYIVPCMQTHCSHTRGGNCPYSENLLISHPLSEQLI
jgi:hypothetical protein